MAKVAVVQKLLPFDVRTEPFVTMPGSVHKMIGPLGRLAFEVDFYQIREPEKKYWFSDDIRPPDCSKPAWYDVFLANAPSSLGGYYPGVQLAQSPSDGQGVSYSGPIYWLAGADGKGVAKDELGALELWARWTRELVIARLVAEYGQERTPQLKRISTFASLPLLCSGEMRRVLGEEQIYLLSAHRSKEYQLQQPFYLGAVGLDDAPADVLVAADAYAAIATQQRFQSLANQAMRLPEDNHPERDWGSAA